MKVPLTRQLYAMDLNYWRIIPLHDHLHILVENIFLPPAKD